MNASASINALRPSGIALSSPKHPYQCRRAVSVCAVTSTVRSGYYGENADDSHPAADFAPSPVVPTVSYFDGEDSFSASKSSQSVYLKDSFYKNEMEKVAGVGARSSIQPIGRRSRDEGSVRSKLPTKRLVAKAVGAFERVVRTNASLEYNRDLVQLVLGGGSKQNE